MMVQWCFLITCALHSEILLHSPHLQSHYILMSFTKRKSPNSTACVYWSGSRFWSAPGCCRVSSSALDRIGPRPDVPHLTAVVCLLQLILKVLEAILRSISYQPTPRAHLHQQLPLAQLSGLRCRAQRLPSFSPSNPRGRSSQRQTWPATTCVHRRAAGSGIVLAARWVVCGSCQVRLHSAPWGIAGADDK